MKTKTKTITKFEPGDFKGCGQLIVRVIGMRAKSFDKVYKVGYLKSSGSPKRITLTAMTDGWTRLFNTEEDLCDHLNRDEGYRPLTGSEYAECARQAGNRFRG